MTINIESIGGTLKINTGISIIGINKSNSINKKEEKNG